MDKRKRRLLCMLEGGKKYKWIRGAPPLSYKALAAGTLENYRIFGNTVGGESVGDLVTSGEHAGEYNVPVTVEGKNLFDENNANIIKGYFNSQTFNIISSSINRTIYIPCLPNTTYTLTKSVQKTTSANRFRACTTTEIPTNNVVINDYVAYSDGTTETNLSITTGANARYLCCFIYSIDAEMAFEKILETIQIEKNFSATPYEPYHAPMTTPIYLPEPIKMVGDEAEYVDYGQQKQHRVRKNLWSGVVEQGGVSERGDYVSNTKRIRSKNVPLEPGTYAISTNLLLLVIYAFNDTQKIGLCASIYQGSYSYTITVPAGANNISIGMMKVVDGVQVDITPSDFEWGQVEKGSEVTNYEPYIENTDLDVTLPALPTLPGTNVLSVGTAVQPSRMEVKGRIKAVGQETEPEPEAAEAEQE